MKSLGVSMCLLLWCCVWSSTAFAADDGIKIWIEPVPGSDVPFTVVEAEIEAMPASVWNIISHCANFTRSMPRIIASKEISRSGDESTSFVTTCEVTADLPFPLPDLTCINRAVNTVESSLKYTRKWTLLSGDYDINEGSWTLVSMDGGKKTKATYRLRAKPKLPLPDSFIANAQQHTMPDVMKKLRQTTRAP